MLARESELHAIRCLLSRRFRGSFLCKIGSYGNVPASVLRATLTIWRRTVGHLVVGSIPSEKQFIRGSTAVSESASRLASFEWT